MPPIPYIGIVEAKSINMAERAIAFFDLLGNNCVRTAWTNTSEKADEFNACKDWILTLQCYCKEHDIGQFQIRIGKQGNVPLDKDDMILILKRAGFKTDSAISLIDGNAPYCLYKG